MGKAESLDTLELDAGSRFRTGTTATEQDRAPLPRARAMRGQLPRNFTSVSAFSRASGSAPSKRDLLQTLREAAAAGRLAPVFAEQLSAAKERGPAAVGRLMVAMYKLRRET
jgi:hypothetical protein